MTSTAPNRDGNGGQDGGIGLSPRPPDLDEVPRTLHSNGIGAPPDSPDPGAPADTRPVAARWADAGYPSAATVAAWTSIGIDTPDIARQWVDAGFTAETAARWAEVPDMTSAEAATCATGGLTPTAVQRIRRADPGWTRPDPDTPAAEPSPGIEL